MTPTEFLAVARRDQLLFGELSQMMGYYIDHNQDEEWSQSKEVEEGWHSLCDKYIKLPRLQRVEIFWKHCLLDKTGNEWLYRDLAWKTVIRHMDGINGGKDLAYGLANYICNQVDNEMRKLQEQAALASRRPRVGRRSTRRIEEEPKKPTGLNVPHIILLRIVQVAKLEALQQNE